MIEGKKLDKIMILGCLLISVVSVFMLVLHILVLFNEVECVATDKGLECTSYVDDKHISGVSCNWKGYSEEQETKNTLSGNVCELVT